MILINGGTVLAKGGGGAAGIGGGNNKNSGTITITGGTITATGGYQAAGIGTSWNGIAPGLIHSILITGGTVNTTGGTDGAGIGSGPSNVIMDAWNSGVITISGGSVTAKGGPSAAGIGGGYESGGGIINLFGGIITATNAGFGAGIGGGGGSHGGGGTITVKNSPSVMAVGDNSNPSTDIGMGSNSTEPGTLRDGADKDLCYVRFVVKGGVTALAIAAITLNGTLYTTNSSGYAAVFVFRMDVITFTINKTGYKQYIGSFVASDIAQKVDVAMVNDNLKLFLPIILHSQ